MQRDDGEAVETDRFRFVGVGDIERVSKLREYESAEAFRVDKEMGARAFLSGREGVGVDIERDEGGDVVPGDVLIPKGVCGPDDHDIRGQNEVRCVRCNTPLRVLDSLGHLNAGPPG
jgi:hypothetical protein